MVLDGSIWKPPVMHSYTSGMPDDLVIDDDILRDASKGALSRGLVFVSLYSGQFLTSVFLSGKGID